MFLKDIIKRLFDKNVIIKYKKDKNGMEIIFCHKQLILFMNKKLEFPIGNKINLKIYKDFSNDWGKMTYIIRGIFDTDGNIHINNNLKKGPYPRITISMKAPILIKQIYNHLLNKNFKVAYGIDNRGLHRITLNGMKQLNNWMEKIGSSNPKHLNKIRACSSVWKNLS